MDSLKIVHLWLRILAELMKLRIWMLLVITNLRESGVPERTILMVVKIVSFDIFVQTVVLTFLIPMANQNIAGMTRMKIVGIKWRNQKLFPHFLVLACIFWCNSVLSQDNTVNPVLQLLQRAKISEFRTGVLNYIGSITKFNEFSIVGLDSSQRSLFYDQWSTIVSMCGDQQLAIRYHDSSVLCSPVMGAYFSKYSPGKKDTAFADRMSVKDALPLIIDSAAKTRIVIISEAHHIPTHRLLTYTLLKDLYDNGYRYLALETLTDTSGLSLGRPLSSLDGYYTIEPIFGNLVRYAISLGFSIISYDCVVCTSSNDREEKAADNLIRLLKTNPESKILIHVGYAHGSQRSNGDFFKPLGYRLKKALGIDPLTIDQHSMRESTLKSIDLFLRDYLVKKYKIDRPMAVFLGNKPFSIDGNVNRPFDFTVINPDFTDFSKYYLSKHTNLVNKAISIKRKESESGTILQLYSVLETKRVKEIDRIIPSFQFLLRRSITSLYPLVPKGMYQLVVRSAENKILSKRSIMIK